MVNDDDVVVLIQKTFQRSLGRPGEIAAEPSLVTRPAEPAALLVLLSKHQKYLGWRQHHKQALHLQEILGLCPVLNMVFKDTFEA